MSEMTLINKIKAILLYSDFYNFEQQELRQAGHYTPVASNKMMHINWLLYNSVLQI